MFRIKINNFYDVNVCHDTNNIHDNEVKNIAEFNLLHAILNLSKCVKIYNSHYSHILYGCVNTNREKTKLTNNIILN